MSEITKPGFTPGPWRVSRGTNEVLAGPKGSGKHICVASLGVPVGSPSAELDARLATMHANAALIASAPELRTALKRVAAALVASSHSEKYVSEDDWNPDAHVEIVLTIADARAVYAAIAKAEGKGTE